LLQAVRDGKVVIINSLGAGLVEARAMLAFLPALAKTVLGTELAIPNVATWWLGRADMREEMIENLDRMVIAPAFEQPSDARGAGEVLGAKLDDAQHRALIESIRDRGVDYVAQEAVTLSSMPLAGYAGRFRAHRRERRRAGGKLAARRRNRRRLGPGARSDRGDDVVADG
jgi:uncharacterized circularly permuted ATP-grasp superfamily protein